MSSATMRAAVKRAWRWNSACKAASMCCLKVGLAASKAMVRSSSCSCPSLLLDDEEEPAGAGGGKAALVLAILCRYVCVSVEG